MTQKISTEEYTKLVRRLKTIGQQKSKSIKDSVDSLEKKSAVIPNLVSDSMSKIKDVIDKQKRVNSEVRKAQGNYKKMNSVSNDILDSSSRISNSLAFTEDMIKSLRQGFSNFIFTLASRSPNASAAVNILATVIDIFSSIENKVINANSIFIKGYANLGNVKNLDISKATVRMADLRSTSLSYGHLNAEADSALESFISAGGNINHLEKSYSGFSDKVEGGLVKGMDLMSGYSRAMGMSLDAMGDIMGGISYSLGSSDKSLMDNIIYLNNAHKVSKINSAAFVDTIKSSVESTSMFGDKLLSTSTYLSYLSSITRSAGSALEIFNETNSMAQEDDQRLAPLYSVFSGSGNEELRDSILGELKDRLKGLQEGTREFQFTNDLVQGIEKIISGDKSNMAETMMLLNTPGVMTDFHTVALDVMLANRIPKHLLGLFSETFGKNLPLMLFNYGKTFKTLAAEYEKVGMKVGDTKNVTAVLESEKKKGNEMVTTADKIKSLADNLLLKNLGPTIYGASMGVKNIFNLLTSSIGFKEIFSPNMTNSKMYKIILDKAEKLSDSWLYGKGIAVARHLTGGSEENVRSEEKVTDYISFMSEERKKHFDSFTKENRDAIDKIERDTNKKFGMAEFNALGHARGVINSDYFPSEVLQSLQSKFSEQNNTLMDYAGSSGAEHLSRLTGVVDDSTISSILNDMGTTSGNNDMDKLIDNFVVSKELTRVLLEKVRSNEMNKMASRSGAVYNPSSIPVRGG